MKPNNPATALLALSVVGVIQTVNDGKGYIPVVNAGGAIVEYQAKGISFPRLLLYGVAGVYAWKSQKKEQAPSVDPSVAPFISKGQVTKQPLDLSHYQPISVQEQEEEEPKDELIEQILYWDASILFSAVTGCGKTTLLLTAIKAFMERFQNINFAIFDPKSSNWLGLESRELSLNKKPVVTRANKEGGVDSFLDFLEWMIKTELPRRQERREQGNPAKTPFIVVIDEWQSLKTYIKRAYNEAKVKEVIESVELIILQGREDLVRVWFVTQGHKCNSTGFTTDVRANLGLIALASPDKTQTIDSAVSDSWLFPRKEDRDRLNAQFNQLQGQYCYCSTLSHDKAVKPTPYYDQSIKDLNLFEEQQAA